MRCTLSAVGAENGLVPFYVNPAHPAGSQLYRQCPDVSYERVSVPCVTIDRVPIASNGALVLKVDCEGAERDILLERYAATLRRFDVIVGEWHNRDGSRYRDVLESIGFDVELKGGGVPQPEWEPNMSGGLIYARRR